MSKEQQIYKKNFLHLSPDLGACLHSVLFASALASTYTRFFSAERLLASWRWYQCKWTRTGSKLSSILLVSKDLCLASERCEINNNIWLYCSVN
ncbi:hypothetical protein MANES_09G055050v8 [Manihot esculenta]|uniref:Uncharacterized protein n=1 Tax=Manihot esculenta TaxID=3983 RepID=A0ACB7H4V0_MANES|nr:hypothetical protein MANES_09G055050v8 [Manihot esculenta]